MILVDSSVWIDFFLGIETAQTQYLEECLGSEPVLVGDLMLTEVLQGFRHQKDFNQAKKLLLSLDVIQIGGQDAAIEAANHFRSLRQRGITIRKTIDTLIATRCILNNLSLLYSDRDFDPFVTHLGLRSAIEET